VLGTYEIKVLPDHWVYKPIAAARNAKERDSQHVCCGMVGTPAEK